MTARRLVVGVLLFASVTGARADEPAPARDIMRKALAHSVLGFDHARLVVTLLVRGSADDPGEARQVVVRTRRRGERIDRALCFLSPPDLKNTAFLSVGGAREQQYLWVPELGRLRQVSRSSRSEPFLGTTFSYRDVEGWELDDATYRALPDEKVGEHPCHVIEATMRPDADGGYLRIVSWVRKRDHMPLRVQFFAADGRHAKTLFTRRVDTQKGTGLSYARSVKMQDELGGGSTVLEIVQADFAATFAPGAFTPDELRRGVDCAP
jgi:hypothetical protein